MATADRPFQLLRRRPALCALILFTFLLTPVALGACSPASAAQPPLEPANPTPDFTVGLLLSSLYDPLYVSLQKGAIESASRLDIELIVRDAGDDPDKQLQQLVELLALGVDAIVLNPVDSAAISAGVQQANQAAVPIVTVERRVRGATVTAHVASDNIAGGEMAAAYLAEVLQEQGNVAELTGIPGTSAAQDRGSGFNRVLGTYPGLTMVARDMAHFNRREARRVFGAMLEQYPDLDGVFAHNDEMILGAIEAAQDAGRAEEIVFVGFDATSDAITAIENGTLRATIAQQPTEMGRIAVELALDRLRGKAIPENIAVDLALVTQ